MGFVCGVLVYGLVGCAVALNLHLIVDVRSLLCQTNWNKSQQAEISPFGSCVKTTDSRTYTKVYVFKFLCT